VSRSTDCSGPRRRSSPPEVSARLPSIHQRSHPVIGMDAASRRIQIPTDLSHLIPFLLFSSCLPRELYPLLLSYQRAGCHARLTTRPVSVHTNKVVHAPRLHCLPGLSRASHASFCMPPPPHTQPVAVIQTQVLAHHKSRKKRLTQITRVIPPSNHRRDSPPPWIRKALD
jgi:hypothetical protein